MNSVNTLINGPAALWNHLDHAHKDDADISVVMGPGDVKSEARMAYLKAKCCRRTVERAEVEALHNGTATFKLIKPR
jgi:hypothetical protein